MRSYIASPSFKVLTICTCILLISCSRDVSENQRKQTSPQDNSSQTSSLGQETGSSASVENKAIPIEDANEALDKAAAAKVFQLHTVAPSEAGRRPDFAWKDGKTIIKLSEISKGKPVFINFWGTWCPPCRRELPDIVELHKEYGNKVLFVGVALENESKASQAASVVSAFAQKNNLGYINLVGDDTLIGKIASAYGDVQAVPTTFIINKEAVIVETLVGGKSKEEFLAALKRVL